MTSQQYSHEDVRGRDVIVLYHDDNDGHVAAAVAYQIMIEHEPRSFKALSVQYGESFPGIELTNNTVLYIVDFSYKREILEKINSQVCRLIVLDHHKSAMEDLKELPYAIFNMNHSGASLAWKYFTNDTLNETEHDICPSVVTLTTDYDLWRRQKDGQENPMPWNFNAGVSDWIKSRIQNNFQKYSIQPQTKNDAAVQISQELTLWIYLLSRDWAAWEIAEQGRPIYENQMKRARSCLDRKKYKIVQLMGYKVALAYFESDIKNYIGEILCNHTDKDGQPLCDFAMTYWVRLDGKVTFGLRSSKDLHPEIDTGMIAKNFDGGGHEAAAGFTSDLNFFLSLLSTERSRDEKIQDSKSIG